MRVLKALDLGRTPAWVTIRPMSTWGLNLFCSRCRAQVDVKDRDIPKQREAVEKWLAYHQRCGGKEGRG